MTDREFFGYDEVEEVTPKSHFKNPLPSIAIDLKTALIVVFGILVTGMGFYYVNSRPTKAKTESFAQETAVEKKPVKVNLGKDRKQNVPPSAVAEPLLDPMENLEVPETLPEPTPEKESFKIVEQIPSLDEDVPVKKGPAPSEPKIVAIPVKKPAPEKKANIEAELKEIVQSYSKVFNASQYDVLTQDVMTELIKSIEYRFTQIGKDGNACIDFNVVKGDDKAYVYAKEIRHFLTDQGYELPADIRQIRTESEVQDVWVWQKNDCVILTVGNPSSI